MNNCRELEELPEGEWELLCTHEGFMMNSQTNLCYNLGYIAKQSNKLELAKEYFAEGALCEQEEVYKTELCKAELNELSGV